MSRKWRIFFGILYAFSRTAFVYLSIRRESSGAGLSCNIFWLLIFAQIFAASIVFGVYNNTPQSKIKLYQHFHEDEPEAIKDSKRVSKAYTNLFRKTALFVILACMLLALCYTGLFYLTQLSGPSIVKKLLSTGIHIPFSLYLTGKMIRYIEKKLFVQFDQMDRIESQRVILSLSYYLDLILIIIDWKLGLFIAALIISREVCVDSSYRTNIKKLVSRRMKDITHSTGILKMVIQYGSVMVSIFMIGIIFFVIR